MMKTLRARLFLKQWRVELPFGLVMEEGPQLAVRVVAAKALGGAKAVA